MSNRKGVHAVAGIRTPITYRVKWRYDWLGSLHVKVQAPVKRRLFGLGWKTVNYETHEFISQMPGRIKEVCTRAVTGYENHKLAWEAEHSKQEWEKNL